jgi:flagellar assembly protein FliH
MSSSPSRAPALPESPPEERPAQESVQALPFPYPEVTVPAGARFPRAQFPLAGTGVSGTDPAALAAQAAEREAAQAREAGRQQGQQEARAKFEEQLAGERSAVAQALADFARERAAYYRKIEAEAVRLALSIARKVLHREAQVDPQLLLGIVRVALERIEGATGVVLAVQAGQAAAWRTFFASHVGSGELPEIVEDLALTPGHCELRTSMGTADLGLEVQLKEIEQGLTDLLAARPGVK